MYLRSTSTRKMAAAKEQPQPSGPRKSENHADAHDPRRAEKEKSLPPAFRRKQAGGAQRDGEQQILGQHVWILQCRIDPGRDRKHLIVRPGRGARRTENILIKSIQGYENSHRHHGRHQNIQLSLRLHRVFYEEDRKDENGSEQSHIETA